MGCGSSRPAADAPVATPIAEPAIAKTEDLYDGSDGSDGEDTEGSRSPPSCASGAAAIEADDTAYRRGDSVMSAVATKV